MNYFPEEKNEVKNSVDGTEKQSKQILRIYCLLSFLSPWQLSSLHTCSLAVPALDFASYTMQEEDWGCRRERAEFHQLSVCPD